MTLSPADELPLHQVPLPIRWVATSDRNFAERFYFNVHNCTDELFLAYGFGCYPNLGVVDAFVVVNHDGHHRVVRASREMGADRTDLTVGPFRLEVLEGLQRVRVVCEPNEWGIALDAVWEGEFPAQLEPRHFSRVGERVVNDVSRYTQTGRWEGSLQLPGASYELTPDRWWGGRDRSWGVRPVGAPEPPGAAAGRPRLGRIHNWAPMQFEDFEILYFLGEDQLGRRSIEEAVRVWPAASGRPVEDLGRASHELTFQSGTRSLGPSTIRFDHHDGSSLSVQVTPLLPLHLAVGTGYGGDDGWFHGQWQGPDTVVQGIDIDLAEPPRPMTGVVDLLSRFECEGSVGYGVFEYTVAGPNPKYGFTSFTDVAP